MEKEKEKKRKGQCEFERRGVEVNLTAEDGGDKRLRRERPPRTVTLLARGVGKNK